MKKSISDYLLGFAVGLIHFFEFFSIPVILVLFYLGFSTYLIFKNEEQSHEIECEVPRSIIACADGDAVPELLKGKHQLQCFIIAPE